MKLLLVFCLLLAGCTVQVVDKRLTREEVRVAFAQRDAMIVALTKKIEQIEQGKKEPKIK